MQKSLKLRSIIFKLFVENELCKIRRKESVKVEILRPSIRLNIDRNEDHLEIGDYY